LGNSKVNTAVSLTSIVQPFRSFCEFIIWKEVEEGVSPSWFIMHTDPKLSKIINIIITIAIELWYLQPMREWEKGTKKPMNQ